MDWQDISTAPKDGTQILVTGVLGAGPYRGKPYHDIIKWVGGWMTFSPWDDTWDVPVYAPTHWMPLPSPPHKQGEE